MGLHHDQLTHGALTTFELQFTCTGPLPLASHLASSDDTEALAKEAFPSQCAAPYNRVLLRVLLHGWLIT